MFVVICSFRPQQLDWVYTVGCLYILCTWNQLPTVGWPKLGFKDTIIGDFFIVDNGSFVKFDDPTSVNEESDLMWSHIVYMAHRPPMLTVGYCNTSVVSIVEKELKHQGHPETITQAIDLFHFAGYTFSNPASPPDPKKNSPPSDSNRQAPGGFSSKAQTQTVEYMQWYSGHFLNF